MTPNKSMAVALILCGLLPATLAGGGGSEPATRPAAPPVATQPAQPRTVSERFGFLGPDVYKAHGPAELVRVADFDADGRNDVLFVNNGKNKMIIYFQEPDGTLKKQEYDIERYISQIAVGDFNGDKRADLAYLGDPEKLVVVYQRDKRRFSEEKEFKTEGRLLAVADIDGDGRDDVVVAGKEEIAIRLQGEGGALSAPVKLEVEDPTVQEMEVVDVDGDGRGDLCTIARNGQQVSYRLQRPGGHFAPAITQNLESLHGATLGRVGQSPAAHLMAFHSRTNALKVLVLRAEGAPAKEPTTRAAAETEEPYKLSTARLFSYGAARATRAVAVGDVTGDKRDDLVVADAGTAQLAVYRQEPGGELARRVLYPTLSAVTDAAIDPKTGEIFLLSPTERILGVAVQEPSGRITFPRPLPIKDRPTAMALANLDGVGGQDLVYAAQEEQARTSYLGFFYRKPDGTLEKSAETHPFKEEDLAVKYLVTVDLDANRLTDLVVFFDYQKPRLLLQRERGKFVDASEEAGFHKGLTTELKRTQLGIGDVNGDGRPELLVATKNFARSLTLPAGLLTVVDQYNGRSGDSTITRAETLDLDADGRSEIVLFDSQARELSILAQGKDKAYTIVQHVETGAFDLRDFLVADLNGDKRPDMVLVSDDKFAIVYSGSRDRQFEVIDQYKTLIEDGHYSSVTTGDLDGDGQAEILVVEGAKHHLEILLLKGSALSQELTFRVYDPGPREYAPRWRQPAELREPSRVIIADINSDGKDDLILLIHDNLVIYRQE